MNAKEIRDGMMGIKTIQKKKEVFEEDREHFIYEIRFDFYNDWTLILTRGLLDGRSGENYRRKVSVHLTELVERVDEKDYADEFAKVIAHELGHRFCMGELEKRNSDETMRGEEDMIRFWSET